MAPGSCEVLKNRPVPYNSVSQSPRRRLCYAISITALRAQLPEYARELLIIVALYRGYYGTKAMTMVAPATSRVTAADASGETYSRRIRAAQFVRNPADTFDISPMRTFSNRKQILMLDATGGTVNRIVHKLFDEGKTLRWQQNSDDRGAYIAVLEPSGITLNVLGCDYSRASRPAPLIIR